MPSSSSSTIIKDGFLEMYKIILSFISRPESNAFRDPVDWKQLGLVDYPSIVKHPMDLGTIKKRLESNYYETIEEVARDMRLVWTNCMLYNRDGSEYYHLADRFGKTFEEAYSAMKRLGGCKTDLDRIPTIDEKIQLSYDIFKVTNIDMGYILTMIEENNPSALTRKISTDEVMINFDAITPRCFHEINVFILDCFLNFSNRKRKHKKRKRPEDSSDANVGDGGISTNEDGGDDNNDEDGDDEEEDYNNDNNGDNVDDDDDDDVKILRQESNDVYHEVDINEEDDDDDNGNNDHDTHGVVDNAHNDASDEDNDVADHISDGDDNRVEIISDYDDDDAGKDEEEKSDDDDDHIDNSHVNERVHQGDIQVNDDDNNNKKKEGENSDSDTIVSIPDDDDDDD